jgi:hypothetical protein
MIDCKPRTIKVTLLVVFFLTVSIVKIFGQDGKALFTSKCQSCHNPFKDVIGPALKGLQERGPWSDKQKLYDWVHNPPGFMAKDPYTQSLKVRMGGSVMTGFPDLLPKDIDAIVDYINKVEPPTTQAPPGPGGGGGGETSGPGAILFGIISLILAVIALILMHVNSNLKKLSDDKENIQRPDPVPFYRNKVYIAMASILIFIVGGYYISKGAIGLGRQESYQPEQPIFYSHKVHAGINQINCLYCHGSAMEGKHANIPSVNICMNCHKAIQEYRPTSAKLYDQNGTEINGTAEIAKLYQYAGFDPKQVNSWSPSKAKPVEWIKIHSLPDFVFFSHAQHVNAGKVQCQTCHGPINEMNQVYQFAELSMSWCVNCHRESKVNFFNEKDSTGNKFYSIYEKFHNDIKNKKMDSVTVKDIGGIECQKCHY